MELKARRLVLAVAAAGFVGAATSVWASPSEETTKAPIRLTDAQMDKVVAGKYQTNPPGNSYNGNSCPNSGQCSYENPQGNPIGKPYP